MDLTADSPDYKYITEYRLAEQMVDRTLNQNSPNADVLSALRNYIHTIAGMALVREEHMARQLQAVGRDNPGAKIGVLIGATHTPLRHMISHVAKTEKHSLLKEKIYGLGTKMKLLVLYVLG